MMTIQEFAILHRGEAFVTAKDLQPLLHISPDRIREYARTKQLPFRGFASGNHWKFSVAEVIEKYSAKQQPKAEPEARQARFQIQFAADTPQELFRQIEEWMQACRTA